MDLDVVCIVGKPVAEPFMPGMIEPISDVFIHPVLQPLAHLFHFFKGVFSP
jgi:hypothetical protein